MRIRQDEAPATLTEVKVSVKTEEGGAPATLPDIIWPIKTDEGAAPGTVTGINFSVKTEKKDASARLIECNFVMKTENDKTDVTDVKFSIKTEEDTGLAYRAGFAFSISSTKRKAIVGTLKSRVIFDENSSDNEGNVLGSSIAFSSYSMDKTVI